MNPAHSDQVITKSPLQLKHWIIDKARFTAIYYFVYCIQVLGTSSDGIKLTSAPDRNGLTPLHHASVESSPFCMAYLLNTLKGAPLKKCLFIAYVITCIFTMKFLLAESCIGAKDCEGRTPLHYAVLYQRQQNVQVYI